MFLLLACLLVGEVSHVQRYPYFVSGNLTFFLKKEKKVLLACLLERSVMYRDTPTLCQEIWLKFLLKKEKKCWYQVWLKLYQGKKTKKYKEWSPPIPSPPPPPPPLLLSYFFRAGAASRPASSCKTPPLLERILHTPLSGQIGYPDVCQSQRGTITEVGL